MSTEFFEAASMFKYYYLDHYPLLYPYPLGLRMDSKSRTFILVQLNRKWNRVLSLLPLFLLLFGGTLSFLACRIPSETNEDFVFQVQYYFWIAIIIMTPCSSALYGLWDILCPDTACFMVAQMVELRLALKKEVGESRVIRLIIRLLVYNYAIIV